MEINMNLLIYFWGFIFSLEKSSFWASVFFDAHPGSQDFQFSHQLAAGSSLPPDMSASRRPGDG